MGLQLYGDAQRHRQDHRRQLGQPILRRHHRGPCAFRLPDHAIQGPGHDSPRPSAGVRRHPHHVRAIASPPWRGRWAGGHRLRVRADLSVRHPLDAGLLRRRQIAGDRRHANGMRIRRLDVHAAGIRLDRTAYQCAVVPSVHVAFLVLMVIMHESLRKKCAGQTID